MQTPQNSPAAPPSAAGDPEIERIARLIRRGLAALAIAAVAVLGTVVR